MTDDAADTSAVLPASIPALEPRGPGHRFVFYGDACSGVPGAPHERTFASVNWLRKKGMETAPHLSCIGSTRDEILEILEHYRSKGVGRIVALRGDLPSGAGLGSLGELSYANELVTLIREKFGDAFHIEVAAYPEYHPPASSPGLGDL